MRREGRQHGTVRTICILPSSPIKPAQRKASPISGSPPTAGIFSRVPTKPTNHSKFTGKCSRPRCSDCHLHPSWKSKDKRKGARKHWSYDVDLGYGGLIACRVMDKTQDGPNPNHYTLKWNSYSATEIFDELKGHIDYDDDHNNHDYCKYDDYDPPMIGQCSNWSTNLGCLSEYPFLPHSIDRVSIEIDELGADDGNGSGDGFAEIVVIGDADDDDMGFYDVAIVWEPIDGDEGWSLVGEM